MQKSYNSLKYFNPVWLNDLLFKKTSFSSSKICICLVFSSTLLIEKQP